MSHVRLSVVVPTFNRAGFLPACVASLRASGVAPLQIIIVDDGSTDETESVVRQLGPGIDYFRQHNRGPAAARNLGVRHAAGDYLGFLDSDDVWRPKVARRLLRFLDRRPELAAVFTDAPVGNPDDGYHSWIAEAGRGGFANLPAEEDGNFRIFEQRSFFRLLTRRNLIFPGAMIMRRLAFERAGGYDPGLRTAEDWEMFLRIATTTRFAYHPEPLAIYTRHGGCVTNQSSKMNRGFRRALRRTVHHARARLPDQVGWVNTQLRRHLFERGYQAYDRGELACARRRFEAMIRETGLDWRGAAFWLLSSAPRGIVAGMRRIKHALA